MNAVVGLWNRTCFLAGLVALLLSFATVAAQVVEVQNTPSPTAVLSGDDSIPETSVSGMQIVSGDWRVKAIYRIQESQVRVIGLFATAQDGTTQGENIVAIYYERPSEQCGEWTAKTWEGGTVRDAVRSLKDNFGIPDIQDVLWEIDVPASGDLPRGKVVRRRLCDGRSHG